MSAIFRQTTSRFASQFRSALPVNASRTFTTSSVRLLKESDHSPDQASENEKHKNDQLEKQKQGNNHWKPELASNSEEAVKADRNTNSESIESMQKKTVEHVSKKSKSGTSQDDSH